MSTERPTTIAQMSADTLALAQALRSVAVGDTISYEQLSAVIARPILERRSSLAAARRLLVRDEKIVFDAVRGVGLKRLDSAGTAGVMPSHLRKIRRASVRARRIGQCVSILDLPVEQRPSFVADVSLLALVSEVTAPVSRKRLEVAASAAPPDTGMLAAEMAWKALREPSK